MASTHKHIRSSTANKRPTTAIADGQIALNTNSASPGLFFKDSTGATIIKIGPVHVGATAPNASPAAGGSAGNSTGEIWLDNSLTPVGVKIWNGSAWVNATPIGSTTVQGLLELATDAETQAGSDNARAVTPASLQSKVSDSTSTTSSTTIASSTAVKAAYDLANAALPKTGGTVTGNLEIGTTGSLSFEGSTADGFETTIAVVDPTADRTITLPNTTGTVVTTGDTGTVTSTMLADGTIVDGDINASAAIAYSKLASLTSANILLGNASNVATSTAVTGDVTISNTGVTAIASGVIVDADINASAAIADTKLATISTAGKVNGTALTGTIPSAVLGNSSTFVGTTSIALNRSSANQALTGISSVALPGSTSGTVTVQPTAIAGTTTITLPATTGTVVTTGDSGTVTSTMIADGTIVNGDINASAAIAGTKISPDFGSQTVQTTGIFSHALGTAAAPTVTFTGDTNTGIYSPGADQVAISTNGSGRLFVDASGRVGMGASEGTYAASVTATGNNGFLVKTGTASAVQIYAGNTGGEAALGTLTSDPLNLITAGSSRIRITSAGLVGIGTSTVGAQLEVLRTSTTDPSLRLRYNATSYYGDHLMDGNGNYIIYSPAANGVTSGNLRLRAGGSFSVSTNDQVATSPALTIDTSGRLGIGTTSPSQPLHVVGNIRSTGSVLGETAVQVGVGAEQQLLAPGTSGGTSLVFQRWNGSAYTETARIDSSSRLLVGTSSSRAKWFNNAAWGDPTFQLETAVSVTSVASIVNNANDDGPGALFLAKSRAGSIGGVTVVNNNDVIGRISFQGADGAEMVAAAQIEAFVDGTPGANDMPGRLVFSTTADGASSPTERMRIDNTGEITVTNSRSSAGSLIATFKGSSGGSNIKFFEGNSSTDGNAANCQIRVGSTTVTNRSINAGGTVNASGADYAEYMTKAGDFDIAKGGICGITFEGLLTNEYSNAVGFVVKSTNPSYVGGDNWGAGFDDDPVGLEVVRQTVDRIAFAGQVPVNVMGAIPGQYIVPVEAADGGIEGVAKNEADLTLAEYMRAVGKVIAIEDDGRARIIVKVA